MAYASPGFWQPTVVGNPSVDYPQLPFPTANQNLSHPRASDWFRNHYDGQANYGNGGIINGTNPSAQSVFGVKTGDFGGNNVFGVKTGDFGNPNPNTPDIKWNTTTIGGRAASGGGVAGGGGYASPGAGGGYGTNAGSLAQWYQDALNKANQANEARYRDALGGYQSRYERGIGMLAGLGQQEGRDINELYDNQGAKLQQDLIGRGLGNSTVMATQAMANNRERNADLGRLNERVRQQAMTTDAGLSGDTLQFMERKTDKPPDVGLLAQLYHGMGQAGYGSGISAMMGGGYRQPDYSGGFNPYMYQQFMPGYDGSSNGPTMAQIYSMARNAGLDTGASANDRYGYSGTGPVSPEYAAAASMSLPAPNLLDTMGDSPIAQAIRAGYTGAPQINQPGSMLDFINDRAMDMSNWYYPAG